MKIYTIYDLFRTRLSINQGFIEKDIILSKPNELITFNIDPKNFGVVLKGSSIEKIDQINNKFSNCFIVNKFDEELDLIGHYLEGKNIVHLVNKSKTAVLEKSYYEKYNIKEILLYKENVLRDLELWYKIYKLRSMGLTTVFLTKGLLKDSEKMFGKGGHYKVNNTYHELNFTKKFPNTGFLAIYYALEVIRPKNLWIIGLDFYQKDYLVRRDWNTPINVMQKKIEKINGYKTIENWIKKYKNTQFNILTYFDGFKPQKNLTLL